LSQAESTRPAGRHVAQNGGGAMPDAGGAVEFPTAVTVEAFARNLARVRERIGAARRRSPLGHEVPLRPVRAAVSEERIRAAVAAGVTELAENKVQEARRKWQALADLPVTWSVIGHLQTNKAKDVAELARELHALDRPRVAEALDRRLQAAGRG